MAQTTVVASGAPAELSLPQRILGIIVSPTPTFQAVVAKPTWLGVLAFTTLVGAIAWFTFLSTDVGRQAFIDQQYEQRERWNQPITPQVEQQITAMAPVMRFVIPGSMLVIGPIFAFAIAGILYMIFAAMMGGGGTYRQVLSVVAHAGVIPTVAGLGVLALSYARETMNSATNLGVFVQMLPDDSFLVRFLGTIDLLWVWYLIVLAIGLAVLYRRKASSLATTFLGLYVVIALVIAGVRSALGGS
jgi:hypothetical protein